MRKAFELRDLSANELLARVEEQSEQLMNFRLQLKSRKLDNPLSYRIARRELARLKTVLNEKRREAEKNEA
jgi:large subunit ribosomal protein L29